MYVLFTELQSARFSKNVLPKNVQPKIAKNMPHYASLGLRTSKSFKKDYV